MGFQIHCDNKGCFKEQEPLLNTETDEVLCSECSKPIKRVTSFAKTQMKALGQIYRGPDKKQQAYAVLCQSCNKQATPQINAKKELVCPHCQKQHQLSGPFKQMLLSFLKNRN